MQFVRVKSSGGNGGRQCRRTASSCARTDHNAAGVARTRRRRRPRRRPVPRIKSATDHAEVSAHTHTLFNSLVIVASLSCLKFMYIISLCVRVGGGVCRVYLRATPTPGAHQLDSGRG